MGDLFGHKKPRKPVTQGDKVRRAVWKAIREFNQSPWEISVGPVAAQLKMPAAELIVLWATEGYRYSYFRLSSGEAPDIWGLSEEKIRAIIGREPDPDSVLLGVDGE